MKELKPIPTDMDVIFTSKNDGGYCEYCGISFTHIHRAGTLPRDFEMAEEHKNCPKCKGIPDVEAILSCQVGADANIPCGFNDLKSKGTGKITLEEPEKCEHKTFSPDTLGGQYCDGCEKMSGQIEPEPQEPSVMEIDAEFGIDCRKPKLKTGDWLKLLDGEFVNCPKYEATHIFSENGPIVWHSHPHCSCEKIKTEPEGWEDRFDSAFFYLEGSGEGPEKARVVNENDVKSFIRNLLMEEKEKTIQSIIKKLKQP